MILEEIRNFDWINEPKNVEFIEQGLLITTKPYTDFWQNASFGISKDDGHFFACNKGGNFSITGKWSFDKAVESAQCGIMIKSDKKNWIKVGMLTTDPNAIKIGVVVANNGYCDWSSVNLNNDVNTVYFKIMRRESNFVIYYACQDEKFEQIRVINHPNMTDIVEAGAYACSPKDEGFDCILEEIAII
jgi:regulation of enolase protein 1 (concanavalin A-like superfamily)